MIYIYRVIAGLIQTIQDTYTTSCLSSSREDSKGKSFLIYNL